MHGVTLLVLLLFSALATEESNLLDSLHLPEEHIRYWVNRDNAVRNLCFKNEICRLKHTINNKHCWGYESNCEPENSYSAQKTKCTKSNSWGRSSTESKLETFQNQGDFRKLAQTFHTIEPICISNNTEGSFLECSSHLRFCYARNIFFDFKSLNSKTSKRYRNDVIRKGQVGGNCNVLFDEKLLHSRADEKSYLQSWAHELEYFKSYRDFRISEHRCDVVFDKPTVLIKLDASVNMYHHFCDFINLYASQHINGSVDMDIDILWWDTWFNGFVDPTFGATWRAFTVNTPHELIDLDGKMVCFRNAMFSMLARQRFGLYYNMPLIDGCEGSGLIHAFSRHILHRLMIRQNGPLLNKIRVTLLSRSTPFRKIINEDELMDVLKSIPDVIERQIDYNRSITFLQQLEITHNSDIFIGMHGSGLTHLLFLPDWAVIFELYNCGDTNCYWDLARLRGVKYFTWTKSDKVFPVGDGIHPQTGKLHQKFQNYRFDRDEFRRLVLMVSVIFYVCL
ncbi:GH05422p, putative [Brugia malayi]|uniref:EGF domain-specific O-linked N-acetylglucosamine transferase n=1 Tax=Brugia malayi TaxID=6279 RepID=A0A4E9EXK5_BRUMA|nr:GH05422p, putative [Brugia malayi]VIO87756.1 GH05422p, putative [Brugia malayi]